MSLSLYKKKRDFGDTPEPISADTKQKGKLIFVVQRHSASHLHYDFRLEMDGVLKSWAAPKGPSLYPKDKRLAMMVEDHPIDYANFKGVIPEGNYGAGIVEIWDKGTYELAPDNKGTGGEALEKGSLKFILNGKKLKGKFALIKLRNAALNSWLLVKDKDEYAVDIPYNSEEHTAKSSAINKLVTNKKAAAPTVKATAKIKKAATAESAEESKKNLVANAITPMMAGETTQPFSDDAWLFEIKWDGYRAIAECNPKSPLLYSRNAISFHKKYPIVFNAIRKIKTSMVLDGEITVLDEEGKPNFQKLQYYSENGHLPMMYYVFDILKYKSEDVMLKPLLERKALLKKVLPENDVIKYCDHVEDDGKGFFAVMEQRNMEGMIAKRKNSVYLPGERSADWLKVKHQHTEEVVIAGYTDPQGERKYFGALVLGLYKKGEFTYIGHSGTGFNAELLKNLYEKFQPYITDENPFETKVPVNNKVHWLKPHFVANIKFSEFTRDGIMRHPVFQGLRIDKTIEDMMHSKPPVKQASAKKTAVASTAKKESEPAEPLSKKFEIKHLDKLYWPDEKLTKGDLIHYYNAVSPIILPYLKDRPQSMKRTPNGIKAPSFFQKDVTESAPDWANTVTIFSESNDKDIKYLICNDKDTLLYMANLGCIELNPWNSTTKDLDKPTYLLIDLDPSEKNSFENVIDVANVVKEILNKAGVISYPKTSGSTGIHIYVPLGGKYSYEECRMFAELIANLAVQQVPEIATVERSIDKRHDKLYIDFLQNKKGQTLAAPYSVRPKPGATVSMPLEWSEVKYGLQTSQFTIKNALERIEKNGDIFKNVLGKGINLQACLKKMDKL